MGGGDQQQLSLSVLQLLALQEKSGGSKLLCKIGKTFLQDTRQRMNIEQKALPNISQPPSSTKHCPECFHVISSISTSCQSMILGIRQQNNSSRCFLQQNIVLNVFMLYHQYPHLDRTCW